MEQEWPKQGDTAFGVRNRKMNEPSGRHKAPRAAANLPSMTDPSAQIASRLKALYQALENEPVPQQFIELLERLDAAEVAQSRE
ncbi:hypothetical protein ILFOPFJJ_02483 [Ensifer psoraleae]|nr:hypothetical protein [Sinorhizobium psoraleae]